MPNKIYRNMLEGEIKTLHSKGEVGRILAHKMLESERASKKYIFSKYANDELGRKKLIQELFKHKHYKEILANEEYKKLLTYDMCFEIIKHDSNASIIIRDMKLFELTKDQQKMLIELCLKEQIDQLKTDKDLRNWRESGYVYMPLMGVESINKAVSNLERYTLSHIRHNYEDPKIQIAKLAAAWYPKYIFTKDEYKDLYNYETYHTIAHISGDTRSQIHNIDSIVENIEKFPANEHKKIFLDIIYINNTIFARDTEKFRNFKDIDIETAKKIISHDKKVNSNSSYLGASFIKCMRWRFSAEEQNIIAKEFIQKDLIHVVANNISWFDNIDDEIIARLIKDGYISYIPKKYLVLHKK